MSTVELPTAAPSMIAALVGNPGTAHMQLAREIRESLPEQSWRRSSPAVGTRAAACAGARFESRAACTAEAGNRLRLSAAIAAATADLEPHVDALNRSSAFQFCLRAFPALRQLTTKSACN
jgi:hypothetical protein